MTRLDETETNEQSVKGKRRGGSLNSKQGKEGPRILFLPRDEDVISAKPRLWNLHHPGNIYYSKLVNEQSVLMLKRYGKNPIAFDEYIEYANKIIDEIQKPSTVTDIATNNVNTGGNTDTATTVRKPGRFLQLKDSDGNAPTHCTIMTHNRRVQKVVANLKFANNKMTCGRTKAKRPGDSPSKKKKGGPGPMARARDPGPQAHERFLLIKKSLAENAAKAEKAAAKAEMAKAEKAKAEKAKAEKAKAEKAKAEMAAARAAKTAAKKVKRKRPSIRYTACQGDAANIHPYALELITMLCNQTPESIAQNKILETPVQRYSVAGRDTANPDSLTEGATVNHSHNDATTAAEKIQGATANPDSLLENNASANHSNNDVTTAAPAAVAAEIMEGVTTNPDSLPENVSDNRSKNDATTTAAEKMEGVTTNSDSPLENAGANSTNNDATTTTTTTADKEQGVTTNPDSLLENAAANRSNNAAATIAEKAEVVTESDKERRIRLQLRHRYFAARSANMNAVEFSRKILETWGGKLSEVVVDGRGKKANKRYRKSTANVTTGKTTNLSPGPPVGSSKKLMDVDTASYLKAWMMSPEHVQNPYPSLEEKQKILEETGIDEKKLSTWLCNNRKRYWKPRVQGRLRELGLPELPPEALEGRWEGRREGRRGSPPKRSSPPPPVAPSQPEIPPSQTPLNAIASIAPEISKEEHPGMAPLVARLIQDFQRKHSDF